MLFFKDLEKEQQNSKIFILKILKKLVMFKTMKLKTMMNA